MTNIRPSPIAGTWYPGDSRELANAIARYLDAAPAGAPPGRMWGILVPHAAYHYSGAIAAYAFRSLMKLRPELVVVISPLHFAHPAPLLTTAHSAYQTPLGPVAVDVETLQDLNRRLRARAAIEIEPIVCDREHSLEIQLPFLQAVLGGFRLVPIMMRDQSSRAVHALGTALAECLAGKNALFVASSDLVHYLPESEVQKIDALFLDRVKHFDLDRIAGARSGRTLCACGSGAVAAALGAMHALGANRVTLLRHGTSAESTGDTSSVVGYAAAAVWQATEQGAGWEEAAERSGSTPSFETPTTETTPPVEA